MNPRYDLVADRATHRCEYCRAPESVFNFPFEVEHVVPLSLSGPDEPTNLALACRSCNVRKGSRVRAADPETGEEVALFDPRHDDWDDHFSIDSESGTIAGKTSRGRATIMLLGMNHATQLSARRLWMRLGLFP